MEKVGKQQLIQVIAEKAGVSKKDAGEVIDSMLEIIVEALKEGKTVGLPGFGTLSVVPTKERQAVRPGTTDRITVPAGKKIRFKTATSLQDNL
ncbi:HU family DNA-binding protein [Deinococcus roseus]|uniref:DNA-binding protein n=1 Tax=Deinococcus roseus TaxID=392414 RepID=A0ABQ2D0N2_9DEIO|nr:HU family DNA-binding protein [Deinococcus roseus]GGJ39261.1 hypothetical protein GCM10008938_26640 [Deinococcus roseus]